MRKPIRSSRSNTVSKNPTNYLHRDHDVGTGSILCGLSPSLSASCKASMFGSFPVSVFRRVADVPNTQAPHWPLTIRSDVPSVVSLYAHLALGQRRTRPLLPQLWSELIPKRSAISACASCWRCRESADAGFATRFRGWAGRIWGCLLAANSRRRPVDGSQPQ